MTTALLSQAVRGDPRPDAELLSRFVSAHDSQAFAAVVRRHGPLVDGVCRRTLGDTADADDAFQATFLVLVTKAGGLKKSDALGPWLFGVAHRVARKARWKRARRSATEQQVPAMPHPETAPPDRLESDELSRAFDEELANLPDDMRRAVVLCELQGVSRADAAKQLRISEGTLSSRLARARKKLAEALTKRGLGVAIPAAGVVSAKLAADTVALANGPAAVPAGVTYLVQEALKTMAISKLKLGAVVLAAAVGCTLLAFAADKPTAKAEPAKAEAKPDPARVVTTVGGMEVTRAEFAEFSARRHALSDAADFLEMKLVRAEAERRKVSVTPEEIDAEVKRQADQHGGRKKLLESVRGRYGSQGVWVEQRVTTDLLLEKMIGRDAEPTEAEVRARFANVYGERRSYEHIRVSGVTAERLDALVAEWNKNEDEVDADTINTAIGNRGGGSSISQFGREAEEWSGSDEKLRTALFRLKRVGEVVRHAYLGEDQGVLKLTAITPAQKGRRFEVEKEEMTEQARQNKRHSLRWQLIGKLVDPVRDQFYLDVMKEYAPDEYAAYLKAVEKQKK
jgi:RNA polymerase sigma factor (sigma-70 family)